MRLHCTGTPTPRHGPTFIPGCIGPDCTHCIASPSPHETSLYRNPYSQTTFGSVNDQWRHEKDLCSKINFELGTSKFKFKQKCIPVGCVTLPAATVCVSIAATRCQHQLGRPVQWGLGTCRPKILPFSCSFRHIPYQIIGFYHKSLTLPPSEKSWKILAYF